MPFDRRVLHELFIPAGDGGRRRSPGRWSWPRSPARPRPPATPSAACSRCWAGSRTRASTSRSSWPSTTCPTPSRPRSRRRPARVPGGPCARRTSPAAPTSAPWATVTVDPETARDHDDAISLDRLPNGHWLLAVHIADVAHYVREGGAPRPGGLPARHLGLLPGPRGAHAAPRALQQHLQPGRGPGSPDPDGRARARRAAAGCEKAEFHDGVIRSAARMTYQQVQAIVDGDAAAARALRAARRRSSSAWTSWPS